MYSLYVKLLISCLLFVHLSVCHEIKYRERIFKNQYLNNHTCKHHPNSAFKPFYRKSILENTVYLVFIILFGILFGLMLLGCIKGLLGVFVSKKVGKYGMPMLIDLPKPLDKYQEPELADRTVCYDVVGWPVHPDTGERTVQILPIKTEFCLNLIFFLAYPLAIMVKLCAICCCIGNYKGEEDAHFREVNVIKYGKLNRKESDKGPRIDVYKENDLQEAKDTNYVINCMRQSQMSLMQLQRSRNSM
ncbi:uncharacterized protein [Euwallacea similis]|uniref:uncharacterized protein n=1 Tax=Euwallacea similis TaxID=1736056 RepID=UPI00344F6ED8